MVGRGPSAFHPSFLCLSLTSSPLLHPGEYCVPVTSEKQGSGSPHCPKQWLLALTRFFQVPFLDPGSYFCSLSGDGDWEEMRTWLRGNKGSLVTVSLITVCRSKLVSSFNFCCEALMGPELMRRNWELSPSFVFSFFISLYHYAPQKAMLLTVLVQFSKGMTLVESPARCANAETWALEPSVLLAGGQTTEQVGELGSDPLTYYFYCKLGAGSLHLEEKNICYRLPPLTDLCIFSAPTIMGPSDSLTFSFWIRISFSSFPSLKILIGHEMLFIDFLEEMGGGVFSLYYF
ncbi:Tryptophan synthase alpha chain [Varanus komodoensis]|nr:Tryptophan synthase alpha chain [Varanus komodoensis]